MSIYKPSKNPQAQTNEGASMFAHMREQLREHNAYMAHFNEVFLDRLEKDINQRRYQRQQNTAHYTGDLQHDIRTKMKQEMQKLQNKWDEQKCRTLLHWSYIKHVIRNNPEAVLKKQMLQISIAAGALMATLALGQNLAAAKSNGVLNPGDQRVSTVIEWVHQQTTSDLSIQGQIRIWLDNLKTEGLQKGVEKILSISDNIQSGFVSTEMEQQDKQTEQDNQQKQKKHLGILSEFSEIPDP